MKRSYSFLVEIAKETSWPTFKAYGGKSVQPFGDFEIMIKEYPPPKRGKVFKITYTLAPKKGEFVVTQNTGTSICFEFLSEEKTNPTGEFLNCLIEDSDWENGTRFNRKVEVVRGKKTKGQ